MEKTEKIVETKEMSCHGASPKEAEFGVYTVQFSPVT